MSRTRPTAQYMHPLISPSFQNDDPWKRNYFAPPKFGQLQPRTAQLIDVRPELSRTDYSPLQLLQTHGFGIVQHESKLLSQHVGDGGIEDVSPALVKDLYQPEMVQLIKSTLGATHVFVMVSALRQGKDAPEEYKVPTQVNVKTTSSSSTPFTKQGENQNAPAASAGNTAVMPTVAVAKPVRVPHLDFTPLGARQTIRFQQQDIHDAAAAVIAAEDAICVAQKVDATSSASNLVIAENYNNHDQGTLGPRYAAFSIWRPLRKVERDPLTLSPRRESQVDGKHPDKVYWPYLNKVPGTTELGGDYLKEYATLGVRSEEAPPGAQKKDGEGSEWYYISEQQPNEVLFVKLFDSASLGPNSEYMGPPWHASPEIGDIHGNAARESLELRVLVIW